MPASDYTSRKQQAPADGYTEAQIAELEARLQLLQQQSDALTAENAALQQKRALQIAGQLADDTSYAQVQLSARPVSPAALGALAQALTICRDRDGAPLTAAEVEAEGGIGNIHRHVKEFAARCCALLTSSTDEDAQRLKALLTAAGKYVARITAKDALLFAELVATLHTAAVELNGQPEQQLWGDVLDALHLSDIQVQQLLEEGNDFRKMSKHVQDICSYTAQVLEQEIKDAQIPGALLSATLLQVEGIVPDLLTSIRAEAERSVVHWQKCIGLLTPVQLATSVVQSQPWLVDPAAVIVALQLRQPTAC